MKRLAILILLIFPAIVSAGDFSIMAGYRNTNILWDNLGKDLIAPQTEEGEDFVRGGSFDVAQPGIEVRLEYYLNDRFTIPLGFDYSFFSAKELVPLNNYIYFKYDHLIKFTGIYTGLYYTIKKYDILNTRIYGGIDARASFINNIEFKQYMVFREIPELNDTRSLNTKSDAFRFGGTAKIGVDATFNEYLNMHFDFAYSIINLIGADDERGELFSVDKDFQNEESLVHMFHISLMLQYNFKK